MLGSKKTFPVYYYEASDLHVATILALDPLIFLLLGGRMLPDLFFFLKSPTNQLFGIFQLYIEGYLQAMLDSMYRQEYLRVRVIDNQVTDEKDSEHIQLVFNLET